MLLYRLYIMKKTQTSYNHHGFTLIEIMTVIITVGVLAGLALPRFGTVVERTRSAEGVQILTALLNAQRMHELETGVFTSDPDLLDVEISAAPDNFNAPTVLAADPATATAVAARIVRQAGTPGGYTLSIQVDGTITCAGGTPATICTQLGY